VSISHGDMLLQRLELCAVFSSEMKEKKAPGWWKVSHCAFNLLGVLWNAIMSR